MIAHFQVFHPFTHFNHNAGTLVTKNRRESAFGVIA